MKKTTYMHYKGSNYRFEHILVLNSRMGVVYLYVKDDGIGDPTDLGWNGYPWSEWEADKKHYKEISREKVESILFLDGI